MTMASIPLRFFDLRTNGIHLRTAEAGPADGPLVFLLHGFPEGWLAWRHQMRAFAQAGYRVLAPDLRGYGHSDKPPHVDHYRLDVLAEDILQAGDSFGRGAFRIVGHDWGASVGWWLATRHPRAVERFVALNAPHPSVWHNAMTHDARQRRKSWYVRFFGLPWLPERLLAVRNFRAMSDGFKDARPGAFSGRDLAIYRQAWSQPGALRGMLNWYRALLRWPPPPPATLRVAPPTLLIWGTSDRYAARELAEASLGLCERGRIAWVEGASHWVQHDAPDHVNRLCLEFLAGEEGSHARAK